MWTCPHCDEPVEESFDLCWSCGAARDRSKGPGFDPPEQDADESPYREDARAATVSCRRCGSPKLMEDLSIVATGDRGTHFVFVFSDADPDALLFPGRAYARMVADVCADCGHVELRIPRTDTDAVYEAYLAARRKTEEEPA